MKKTITICTLLFICLACKSHRYKILVKDSLLELDFQDFFKNNNVSLTINNTLIFNKVKMMSEEDTGFTGFRVKIYSDSILVGNKSKYCKSFLYKENILTVIVDGIESKLNITLNNGKYIGLSKKEDNSIFILQDTANFFYN